MHSAAKKLLHTDSQLTKLFSQSEDNLALTQQCLKLAAELIQSAKHTPDSLLALAFLGEQKTPALTPALRAASLFTFIGLRLQFNEHYLQHLVAATYAASQLTNTDAMTRERIVAFQQFCQRRQLDIFVSLLKVAKAGNLPAPERYLQESKLSSEQIWLIVVFSILTSKASTFTEKMKPAVNRLSSIFHADFNALLSYPGGLLPGTAIRVPAGNGYCLYRLSINTAAVWMSESNQVEEIACQRIKPTSAPLLSLNRWQTLTARFSPELKPAVRQLFPQQYPISHLPADLRSIIAGLQDSNADIPALARRIENIPVFASYLKDTASTDNRLQLAVRDVKQAMLTYGMTRVADMLVLRALSQRLHQRYFPLMPVFIRLSEVIAAVASEITQHTRSKQTPQTMALLATFVCAPLFTVAGLKTLKRWPENGAQLHNLNSLWKSKTQSFSEMSTALARQWHQPPHYQAIISHSGRKVSELPGPLKIDATIIGLAVLLARQWLFGITSDDSSSDFEQKGYAFLNINHELIGDIQSRLSPLLWLPYTQ